MPFLQISKPRPELSATLPLASNPIQLTPPALILSKNSTSIPQYRLRPSNHFRQNTTLGSSQQRQEQRLINRTRFCLLQALCLLGIVVWIMWTALWRITKGVERMVGRTGRGRGTGRKHDRGPGDAGSNNDNINGETDSCRSLILSDADSTNVDDNWEDIVSEEMMQINGGILKLKTETLSKRSIDAERICKKVRWVDEEGVGDLVLSVFIGELSVGQKYGSWALRGDRAGTGKEIRKDERFSSRIFLKNKF